jgi:hypothetical protein
MMRTRPTMRLTMRHSENLEKLAETQANQGARLNAIDGRLALIKKHTGMVKA